MSRSHLAMSLPTPQIGHLTEEDYEHVYEPAGETAVQAGHLWKYKSDASYRGLFHPSRCS